MIIIAFGAVAWAYDLQKRYPFKYLSDFFYYLIAIYFYWFVIIALPDLLLSILREDLESRYTTLYWIFVLFSLPCFYIGLYFFISLFIHLRKEKIPKWITLVYTLVAIALCAGLGLSLKFSIGQANLDVIGVFYVIVRSSALVVRLSVIAYAFFGSVRCNDRKQKRLIQTLSVYYFVGFILNSVVLEYAPMPAGIRFYFSPLFYVLINIPPLFVLRKYAKMIFKDRLLTQEDKIDFEKIFHQYGLSKREQEIFVLILKGKSNKEIGETLFISVKTVKNHIYNIFQKFGVNSRIKLYVFIRSLTENLSP
ncbi:MAG: helix-turn-helix transcriptional regulator [Candidatus Aminicenantes bacterium]